MKPSEEDLKKAKWVVGKSVTNIFDLEILLPRVARAIADQREEDAQIVDAHAIAQIEGRAYYTMHALEDAAAAIRKGKP